MKKRLVALGMAFLMAMSTCMTAFAGYWYLEDGRWEYRDDSGARVRNTLKKSGSHYWWLGPDGYLRTGHVLWSSIFVTLVAKKYHESVTLPSGLRMVYDNH